MAQDHLAPIRTSDRGSFAEYTFKVRVPGIIDETRRTNTFPAVIDDRLIELKDEILKGVIRPLRDVAGDVADWNSASAHIFGRSWLDAPWYWAEAYFYRRLLEAVGYDDRSPWLGFDLFAVKKRQELEANRMPQRVETALKATPDEPAAAFEFLLHTSLWSNRNDLSNLLAMNASNGAMRTVSEERDFLLVDETAAVLRFIQSINRAGKNEQAAIICDNAGIELGMDLVLADFLLRQQLFSRVTLHLKAAPFFVSDATISDLQDATSTLATAGSSCAMLAERLAHYRTERRLNAVTHAFYTSGRFYSDLPLDLQGSLTRTALTFVKGDLNYRRLINDTLWPATAPFARYVSGFPCPVVALRTLKSEPIVGLPAGVVERLDRIDNEWRLNGKHGIIQARVS